MHTALTVACYAWTHCEPPGRAGTDWAMSATISAPPATSCPPHPLPLVTYGDQQPRADTRELRADAAVLVSTVAALLEAAAADPHADPDHARARSQAARRLRTAAMRLSG